MCIYIKIKSNQQNEKKNTIKEKHSLESLAQPPSLNLVSIIYLYYCLKKLCALKMHCLMCRQ